MNTADKAASLTAREETILALAAKGHTDKAIAESLGISKGTVEGHWVRIRLKLRAPSRTAVVALRAE